MKESKNPMSDWLQLEKTITGYKRIFLLVHEKPDGDCLGAALALGLGLKTRGFEPVLLLPDRVPALYAFLRDRN